MRFEQTAKKNSFILVVKYRTITSEKKHGRSTKKYISLFGLVMMLRNKEHTVVVAHLYSLHVYTYVKGGNIECIFQCFTLSG